MLGRAGDSRFYGEDGGGEGEGKEVGDRCLLYVCCGVRELWGGCLLYIGFRE